MVKLNTIFQSAGVQFPQRPHDIPKPHSTPHVDKYSPPKKESAAPQCERNAPQAQAHIVSESRYHFNMLKKETHSLSLSIHTVVFFFLLNQSQFCYSILQKAGTALEVLRDVLNTIDTQHPEVFTVRMYSSANKDKIKVLYLQCLHSR